MNETPLILQRSQNVSLVTTSVIVTMDYMLMSMAYVPVRDCKHEEDYESEEKYNIEA